MSTDRIRSQIEGAWRQEADTKAFASLVRQQLVQAGAGAVPEDSTTVADILSAWRLQLENVPDLIDAMRAAAENAGMSAAVAPVLAAAERYFLDDEDVLPDAHGVLGLLDDMYLALTLLHEVSERHRHGTGQPLIDVDLAESIGSVRPLFRGARLAALDERIRRTLVEPALIRCIERLSGVKQGLALSIG
jgi:uncharacterized membrane protein YkvA (DUF1232 family)